MRRLQRYWRSTLIVIVFWTAFGAFLGSGMLSGTLFHRVATGLYYAGALFLLGGLDAGLPHDVNAPSTIILWVCYFVAPLLTASFVYDFIQARILNRIPRRLSGHTIICGLGRNGRLIYELARQSLPKNHPIVVIEQNEKNPHLQILEKDPSAWRIKNDFTQMPVLQSARVEQASRIIFSTNQDLENLNAVVALQSFASKHKKPAVFCHLGDLEMLDNFSRTLFREPAYERVHVFNGYQCATRRLMHRINSEKLLSDSGNVFILFGYGRFARMLFSHIARVTERTPADEIIIVTEKLASGYDLTALLSDHSETHPALGCHLHQPIIGDMHNPEIWEQLDSLLVNPEKRVIAFVCRDHDIANLDLAISIKLRGPQQLQKATFICRIYAHTVKEINEMLDHRLTPNQTHDVILFPLQAELKNAFDEEIFSAASASEAK